MINNKLKKVFNSTLKMKKGINNSVSLSLYFRIGFVKIINIIPFFICII